MASEHQPSSLSTWRFWIPALLLLASVPWLQGCLEADTLGGKAPDEIVISGTPTWDNGVAELMGLKCAVCHALPQPDEAPSHTPRDLDLARQQSSGGTRGAEDIAPFIAAGILSETVLGVPSMPLEFSTPLTSNEITALERWAELIVNPEAASSATDDSASGDSGGSDGSTGGGTVDTSAGEALYATNCQSCHGVNGVGSGARPNIQSAGKAQIDSAIASVTQMASLSSLSSTERQQIADFLAAQ